MDIYVLSRGFSQDYYWLKITNQNESSVSEVSLIPDFSHLIDTSAESLSLVLSRSNGRLILFITGFETSERQDKDRRKIRNSVAWIGENCDDESVIRALIVQALRDELTAIIDNAVKNNADGGFDILWSEYSKLIPPGINGQTPPNEQTKIGNLKQRKKQLADEITDLTQLPQHNGLLVVVTGICDKNNFKNANVWRGLSSQINLKDEDWKDAGTHRKPDKNNIVLFLRNFHKLLNRIPTVVFVIVTVFSLVINILLLKPFIPIQKNQETNMILITENQKLKDENLYLKDDNKRLEVIKKSLLTQQDDLFRSIEHLKKQRDELESDVKSGLLKVGVTGGRQK